MDREDPTSFEVGKIVGVLAENGRKYITKRLVKRTIWVLLSTFVSLFVHW
jgi:hypothetical protein